MQHTVRRALAVTLVGVTLVGVALFGVALAHQSIVVGDAYRVTVGFVTNPAYAGQLNRLDLIVSTTDDPAEPVEGLEASLGAELIAPDGVNRLQLAIRAVRGQPGHYTADFIPTAVGDYAFRVYGFVGDVEFDELFDHFTHYEPGVADPATISLPAGGR